MRTSNGSFFSEILKTPGFYLNPGVFFVSIATLHVRLTHAYNAILHDLG